MSHILRFLILRHAFRCDKDMRNIGNRYEELAAKYLEETGYRILARNVTYRFGEIDLVVLATDHTLVFVEVRERSRKAWIRPEETVSFHKQRRLHLSIQAFLARYQGHANRVRIDLVAFDGDQLRHFPDFFPAS